MKSKIDGLLQGAIKWQEKRREKAMDSSDFSANSWHIKRGGVKHADRKMESDIGLDVLRSETACLSKTGLQSVCASAIRFFCARFLCCGKYACGVCARAFQVQEGIRA